MLNVLMDCLWIIASLMIFVCGVYFSFKLDFIHLSFKKMIKALKTKTTNNGNISAFESLTMSLAGRIGVGSLSGIALALYVGGPGILFWIWITSLLAASTTFAESILAVKFRKKESSNMYQSGPFYYIRDGLKNKNLAIIYAFIILIAYTGGFSTMQVNTISKCMEEITNIKPIIVGIVIAILAGMIIFGGAKKIAETTSRLVPLMTLFYLLISFYIISNNIDLLAQVLEEVFNSAFNIKAFGGGVLSTLLIGMQKGIFSSEVGLGTGSIVAGAMETDNPNSSGLIQTLGIHIENILFATVTVFVICMSEYKYIFINDPNGIELTMHAFNYHIGYFGSLFVVITIILFGLSSIVTGYYYGESSLKFIMNTSKTSIFILKLMTLFILIIGSIASSNLLWMIVDILVGIMAIINIYALFKLKDIIIGIYKKNKYGK